MRPHIRRVRPGRLTAAAGSLVLAWAALLTAARPAVAHDPPVIDFDRRVVVTLTPTEVRVRYRLEISTFTLSRLPQLDPQVDITAVRKDRPERGLAEAYLQRLRVLVPDQLFASLNGQPLAFEPVKGSIDYPNSVHFLLNLRALWKPAAGTNRFEITDDNFKDLPGPFRLRLEAASGVNATELDEPPERSGATQVDESARRGSAVFEVTGAAAEPVPREPEPPAEPEPGNFLDRIRSGRIATLFDTSAGLLAVFGLAFLFGAAHALTPGHGKTLVAAYLVGERGTVGHAVLLGVITTVTHTGSVILIAAGLWYYYPTGAPADVQRVLGFVGGMLIAGLGLWLLLRRLAGQADHIHLFGHGHSHSHGGHEHGHSHGEPGAGGTRQLILLGITGGIIPCWDAVILLGIAISTHQLWLGVPLLLAFSTGLAGVLIAIGVAVVHAKRLGAGRWSERGWFRALPAVSAVAVVLIGLWLCFDSLR